ncbi:hypothetical protein GCM10023336_11120 [Streptomyces similanensis]|uniref:Uncharacterized protein n=1 Tax=Streptomyces similanensis TaxID=1274988 RepID=A0ABP9JY90_9ACTN
MRRPAPRAVINFRRGFRADRAFRDRKSPRAGNPGEGAAAEGAGKAAALGTDYAVRHTGARLCEWRSAGWARARAGVPEARRQGVPGGAPDGVPEAGSRAVSGCRGARWGGSGAGPRERLGNLRPLTDT